MTTILVTGATGTNGRQVVAALAKGPHTVRAGVRSPEKAQDLRDLGAELVEFDYENPKTLKSAFAGAERAFLLTPFVEDPVPLAQRAVDAAKAAGTEFLLRFSAVGADPDSEMGLARQHGLGEKMVADSGIAWAALRPTFFMDNVDNQHWPSIQGQGQFYGASAGKATSYVSTGDIAAVAATILDSPQDHAGKQYDLTGPEAVTDSQIAEMVGSILGREVQYVDLSPEAFGEGLRGSGVPDWAVNDILALEYIKAQGWAAGVSPNVENILGRAPETFRAYLERKIPTLGS